MNKVEASSLGIQCCNCIHMANDGSDYCNHPKIQGNSLIIDIQSTLLGCPLLQESKEIKNSKKMLQEI